MRGTMDTAGAKEQGEFDTLPAGTYEFEIDPEIGEKITQTNGDPMASIKLVVVSGEYEGQWVWDNIILPNPGSPAEKIRGRSMHFLHCIGEPYEGTPLSYDTDNWKNVKVTASTKIGKNIKDGTPKAEIKGYILPEGIEDSPF